MFLLLFLNASAIPPGRVPPGRVPPGRVHVLDYFLYFLSQSMFILMPYDVYGV